MMKKCATDDQVRADFLNNTHKYLNEMGMNIPESVHIHLDSKDLGWPAVYIKSDDEKIVVAENKLAVEVIEDFQDRKLRDVEKREHVSLKEWSEVDIKITEKLKDCTAVVKLPFLDTHTDMLTEIKFSDGNEIILTSC
jgi:hypothetical protein